MKSERAPKGSPGGLAAKLDARRHLTPHDQLPCQLSLFDEPNYPADRMYPPRAWAAAEWHLRLAVNRMAYEGEPRHWWLRDVEHRRDGAA